MSSRAGRAVISILFLFVATVALAEPQTPTVPPPLVVALRAHRDELRALAVGSIGTSEIDAILAQPIDDDMPPKRRADAAHAVASLGAQARGAWWTTGFIENEAATRVLGAGLLDEDAEVRESACSELDGLGKDEYLAAIAADVETEHPGCRANAARAFSDASGLISRRRADCSVDR